MRAEFIERDGIRVKREKLPEGSTVERYFSIGEGGARVEHVSLFTELELAKESRELVIER